MFNRPFHQRIEQALNLLETNVLNETECFFGGGTAISLMLGEYRESTDLDFLCNNAKGYKKIQELIFYTGHKGLCKENTQIKGDLIKGKSGIRFFLDLKDNQRPIKVEIIVEGYLKKLSPGTPICGKNTLSQEDLIATKLMANVDRGLDKHFYFRDYFDLTIATNAWPESKEVGYKKAESAYGKIIHKGVERVQILLTNKKLREEAYKKLDITRKARCIINDSLKHLENEQEQPSIE